MHSLLIYLQMARYVEGGDDQLDTADLFEPANIPRHAAMLATARPNKTEEPSA